MSDIPCRTITFDNGKEFAQGNSIGTKLNSAIYFAHPHRPWERPINEHTNGLLRQFSSKNTSFLHVTQEHVDAALLDYLNNHPRKRPGWRTPNEAFAECCT